MKPKVAFVIPTLSFGGSERQVALISESLLDFGLSTSVITLLDEPPQHDLAAGVVHFAMGASRSARLPFLISMLSQSLSEFAPDCVITFTYPANALGRAAKAMGRLGGSSLITSVRSENPQGRIRDAVLRLTRRLDEATVFNSAAVMEKGIVNGWALPTRARVIPNALSVGSPPDAEPQENTTWPSTEDKDRVFTWICVASLRTLKRHDLVVQALARATRESEMKQRLLLVGDGPARAHITHLAHELGVSSSVHFLGHRKDVPSLLRRSDAFVLASDWEGSPNALLEAQAAGLPAVVTATRGAKEILDASHFGYLVPIGDADALSAAMVRMLGTHNDFAPIRDDVASMLRQRYSVASVSAAWRDTILESILARGAARVNAP